MFEHDLTYDIYREDITFIDHISTLPGGSMVTHGKASRVFPRRNRCFLARRVYRKLRRA